MFLFNKTSKIEYVILDYQNITNKTLIEFRLLRDYNIHVFPKYIELYNAFYYIDSRNVSADNIFLVVVYVFDDSQKANEFYKEFIKKMEEIQKELNSSVARNLYIITLENKVIVSNADLEIIQNFIDKKIR